MNQSHESLSKDYEVTGVELDTLVEEAWKIDGVIGSRMTGAGFGGCTVSIVKDEAVDAFEYLSRTEGIIPAIESAHAVAHAIKIAPTMDKDKIIVITISGRGDKDCAAMARYRGVDLSE